MDVVTVGGNYLTTLHCLNFGRNSEIILFASLTSFTEANIFFGGADRR